MTVEMKKFGIVLNGRPAGREAALRLFQIVNGSDNEEKIILDFSGVEILTPSFADELLHLIKDKYGIERIKVENAATPAVRDTISTIENEPAHK